MNLEEKPNIVVLVLDTLRAKNASCYGYERETTPNIDRMADEGVMCSEAYTVSPWTLPAHASLFTGRYPSEHGANAKTKTLDTRYPTLAERLREEGYGTVGVSNNLWLSPAFGTARGFDRFELMWQRFDTEDIAAPLAGHGIRSRLAVIANVFRGNPVKRAINLAHGYRYRRSRRRAEKTNDRILEHLETEAEPFFLFANYMEPHLPYRPPKEYAETFLPDGVSFDEADSILQEPWDYVFGDEDIDGRVEILEALYDGAINYLDEQIGRIVEQIEERSDRPTLFVIMSDHGENIGDHGLMSHQYSLENTVLRIPLVFYGPEAAPADIEGKRDLLDVRATILDAAGATASGRGAPVGEEREARDCHAQYLEPSPPVERLAEKYGVTRADLDGRERMEALVSGARKLIRFSDRSEVRENTYDEDPVEDGEELEERLDRWTSSLDTAHDSEERELEENVKKRLEELGYY